MMLRQEILDKQVSVRELLTAAKSLEPRDMGESEYSRGICELIGRTLLDTFGLGEEFGGTGECADLINLCLMNSTEEELNG